MGMNDHEGWFDERSERMYPYVVVRYMATVYGQFPVRFVESEQANPNKADEGESAFAVVCPKPYTVEEQLTPEARQALTDAVQSASRKSGHRLCVVFAKDDCVYVEPEGAAEQSVDPPSGGIQCLQFPIRLKDT